MKRMIRIITEKSARLLISLRVGLSSLFMSVFLFTTIFIVGIGWLSFSKELLYSSNNLMETVTTAINRELHALLDPVSLACTLSGHMIADKIVDPSNIDEVIEYTKDLLRAMPQAFMIHWGAENGSYVVARRLIDDTFLTEYLNRSISIPQRTFLYRDKEDSVIKQIQVKQLDYDPRQRPWYQQAKTTGQTNWTNVYSFAWGDRRGKLLGISSSTPVFKDHTLAGVFSIDIRVNSFSDFLSQQRIGKSGIAFIVDNNGNIIAYPQIQALLNRTSTDSVPKMVTVNELPPHLQKAYELFKNNKHTNFTFIYNAKYYLASATEISQFTQYHWYTIIVVPMDDFVGMLKHYNNIALLVVLFLLLFGLEVTSLFSKQISKPFNKLENELEKIKFFHIDPSPTIKTHIKEVFTMSRAIESMKIGLQSFRKYVPENLVRQLIYSGEAAKIGGGIRQITLFFSDITNFTSIAEHTDPEKIMRYLCEYFDELSRIIGSHKGTIDKYMGDSIMAFWGAPLVDANSVHNACITALECQTKLTYLNEQWRQQNRPVFLTRIGIHSGSVIVGNLGSSERLNYTAIGDSVNVTSRLEQINKIYGTKIIVSEQVKNKIEDQFVLRILDRVTVKGRKEVLTIYELIEQKTFLTSPALLDFCESYRQGFMAYQHQEWDKAIGLFTQILHTYPHDHPSVIMRERCQHFKSNPPAADWQGVWIFS